MGILEGGLTTANHTGSAGMSGCGVSVHRWALRPQPGRMTSIFPRMYSKWDSLLG